VSKRNISIADTWTAVSQAYDDATARNPALGTDLRLVAAARSRMEYGGHAHFKRGELAVILSKAKADGVGGYVLEPLHRTTVKKAIDRMADAGLLVRGSWSEDLILPPFSVQFGSKQAAVTRCPKKPKGNL